jgi:5-methylcytosine-specific restriction endonuclease McrA
MEKRFKTCITCNTAKQASLEFFHKQKGKEESLRSSCKKCINLASRDYYESNKEKITKRIGLYQKKNKDYLVAYNKKWKLENPERTIATHKKYTDKNVNKVLAINRNYRARKVKAEGSHTAEDVAKIVAKQNKLCFWCNAELEKIHIDHIIPLCKGGKNDASNLVASCPSCNCTKGSKLPEEFIAYKQQIKTHKIT